MLCRLPIDDVVTEYIRRSIDCNLHWPLVKYTVQQMYRYNDMLGGPRGLLVQG